MTIDSWFVTYLGDQVLQSGIREYLEKFLSQNRDAMILLKKVLRGWWFGAGKSDDILASTPRSSMRVLRKGLMENLSSTVRDPSIIDEDCIIENSHIGTCTSVGRNSKIIENSIESA